jgi:hypothetical protein
VCCFVHRSNVNLKDTEKCGSLVYSGSVQVSYYCYSSEMEEAAVACACILGMRKRKFIQILNR